MDFSGRTAVVTGGGSGIGRAMARRFGAAGANVVVADIEEPAIDETLVLLRDAGVTAIGVRTDVADEESVGALKLAADEQFGGTQVLCLNAGVAAGGPMADLTLADWQWTLGVNLWGVIHGIHHFLAPMRANDEGAIVITASVAGLLSYPWMGPYNASKHAAVTIAETLHHEVAGTGVQVSVLCPGLVQTQIITSERNRPEKFRKPALQQSEPANDEGHEMVKAIYETAMGPDLVADLVHDAIVERRFWILTDEVFDEALARRHGEIDTRRNPELRGHLLEEQLRHHGG